MDEFTEELEESLLDTEEPDQEFNFATVGNIYTDGVTLIFDGQAAATSKHYKCNTSIKFAPGDRVKILKDSGTYVVEYVVGAPGDRERDIPAGGGPGQFLEKATSADYSVKWGSPLPAGGENGQILKKNGTIDYAVMWADATRDVPAGGTDGQVLTKNGTTNYSVKWADLPKDIPAGGTDGQLLAKSGGLNYNVKWVDPEHDIPTGGTNGQVLTKDGLINYRVKWADPAGIPSGGTNGQVLTKDGSTSYAVKWATPSSQELKNGTYTVTLNASHQLVPGGTGAYSGYDIGTTLYPFRNLYTNGGTLNLGASTIGFFGHTPAARQTVSDTATVATLIQALKAYGLII